MVGIESEEQSQSQAQDVLVIYQQASTELPEALTKGRISIPSSTFLSVTLMTVPFSLKFHLKVSINIFLDHSFLVRWVN